MDVLDLALVVVRRKPATLGLAALVGIAPFAGLNAWLFATLTELDPALPLFLWWFEAPLALAPLTVVLGGLMFARRPTPGRVAKTLLRSAFPLVLIQGFLRFLPPFWVPPRLAFAGEIVLLERGAWWKVWRRGGDLVTGRAGELIALGVLQTLGIYGFAILAYVGTARVGQAFLAEELTWDAPAAAGLAGLKFQAPLWIGSAFFAVARFLAYIDQRIRLEGWEVEIRLRAVAEAMREARRW